MYYKLKLRNKTSNYNINICIAYTTKIERLSHSNSHSEPCLSTHKERTTLEDQRTSWVAQSATSRPSARPPVVSRFQQRLRPVPAAVATERHQLGIFHKPRSLQQEHQRATAAPSIHFIFGTDRLLRALVTGGNCRNL